MTSYSGENKKFYERFLEPTLAFIESLETVSKEFIERKLQHCNV